ncbi:MAG: ribosome recycling factor [bacterium]|nr:ribosome recycling factor [bacterium]
MSNTFSTFKEHSDEVTEWLRGEFAVARSGQASLAVLDKVKVDAYGADTALEHIATVSIEDARTIRIAPWDGSLTKHIESALFAANLGLSIAVDNAGVRVIFPELTEETRKQTVKHLKDKYEEARVRIKNIREKTVKEIDQLHKDGEITEDEHFQQKEELQKLMVGVNANLEAMFKKKERDILNI